MLSEASLIETRDMVWSNFRDRIRNEMNQCLPTHKRWVCNPSSAMQQFSEFCQAIQDWHRQDKLKTPTAPLLQTMTSVLALAEEFAPRIQECVRASGAGSSGIIIYLTRWNTDIETLQILTTHVKNELDARTTTQTLLPSVHEETHPLSNPSSTLTTNRAPPPSTILDHTNLTLQSSAETKNEGNEEETALARARDYHRLLPPPTTANDLRCRLKERGVADEFTDAKVDS